MAKKVYSEDRELIGYLETEEVYINSKLTKVFKVCPAHQGGYFFWNDDPIYLTKEEAIAALTKEG